jgi:prepilin-type N-terminal cleavage/methylation domain-containing protein
MLKSVCRAKRNEQGFTLIELMVVVVIIGILAAIAIPVYGGIQERARDNAHTANIRTLQGVAAMHFSEHGFPDVAVTWSEADHTEFMDVWPVNPYGTSPIYRVVWTINPPAYEVTFVE